MLKTTLLAAAALSFVALGAPTAYAGSAAAGGGGHGGGGWRRRSPWRSAAITAPQQVATTAPIWLNYSWYPSCHYETKKVRIKVWDRYGNPHFKWVWRDVKVC